MKRPNRGCIVFLLAGVLGAMGGTAWAQEAPAAPAAAPAEHKFTGDKQGFFMSGGVADGAFWALGTTFPSGLALSAGVDINYDGNGLTMGSSDKFAFSALLYGAYYVVNKFPVGIAPEVAVILPISPTAGSPATIVQPGIGVFYAPFPVPLVFSSALDLAIVIPKTGSTAIHTVTPGLRLIYVFP
ncbi:MAG TPA: hypothetical protein VIX73_18995 [Kofleriaceae bacterium]|jgi:hypothetical protein